MPIYADHAASTPMLEKVQKRLVVAIGNDVANAHAPHALGRAAYERLESCRQLWLDVLGAHPGDQVIFTSSATESNNTVIASCLSQAGAAVIYCQGDHASVTVPVNSIAQGNVTLHSLPLTGSLQIDIAELDELLTRTSPTLLILSHVNSLSGHVLDIQAIASHVKSKTPEVHVHVDAAQSLGKLPVTVKASVIDSMSFSSHKMGGPKGVGGLYLRDGVSIEPLLKGGGQELGLRSSTPPVALIEAFTQALTLSDHHRSANYEHVAALTARFYQQLADKLPSAYCPFKAIDSISPYIISIFIPDIPSDVIVRHLEQEGIYISSRSACSSKKVGISLEWKALHVPDHWHTHALRISFSAQTTHEEVTTLVKTLAATVSRLQLLKG